MALQERDFFTEKPELRPARLQCPRCRRTNEFKLKWMRRTKKDRLPPGADERDRAMFAKLRDYLLRLEDMVQCPTCRTRFEVPSHQSLIYLHELEGLPKDVEDDEP